MEDSGLYWIIALVVIVIGFFFFTQPKEESKLQQNAECVKTANMIYDNARQRITLNSSGYNQAEQSNYYTSTENAYARNLKNCEILYDQ
jgi:hypothetical protein